MADDNHLIIRYQDSDGNVTERRISEIEPEGTRVISAFCHLRNAQRIFYVPRILSATHAESGQPVSDLYSSLGLPRPPEQRRADQFQVDTTGRLCGHSAEAYKGQRNREKRELFARFHHRAIAAVYKAKFFSMFGDRCFKCGSTRALVMDHHIPMIMGGHLEPGNLVSLCRRCNGRKLDASPDDFYTAEELRRLQPLLEQQKELIDFQIDIARWMNDREAYMLDLGVDPQLVHQILHDPYHRDYVGVPRDGPGIFVSLESSNK